MSSDYCERCLFALYDFMRHSDSWQGNPLMRAVLQALNGLTEPLIVWVPTDRSYTYSQQEFIEHEQTKDES